MYPLYLLYFARGITGSNPDINSAYRSPEVNGARGGAERSRHMWGEGIGKDYAGLDLQFPNIEAVRPIADMVRGHAGGPHAFGDAFRKWSGFDVGVGVIVYDETVHLDAREHDWASIKAKSGLQ